LRTLIINRAQAGGQIQGQARAVTALIHTADAGVFYDEFFGDKVSIAECDDEVATFSATSTGRDIGVIVQRHNAPSLIQPYDWPQKTQKAHQLKNAAQS